MRLITSVVIVALLSACSIFGRPTPQPIPGHGIATFLVSQEAGYLSYVLASERRITRAIITLSSLEPEFRVNENAPCRASQQKVMDLDLYFLTCTFSGIDSNRVTLNVDAKALDAIATFDTAGDTQTYYLLIQ